MQSIRIPAAERTPEVEFDFASGRLSLAGESYPEDTAAFFRPATTGPTRLSDHRPRCHH